MPITATVTAFVSPVTEYDQYVGQPALRVEGALVIVELSEATALGFDSPVSHTVGSATIQLGAEYDNIRTNQTGDQTPIETIIAQVSVVSDAELVTVPDGPATWVLPSA